MKYIKWLFLVGFLVTMLSVFPDDVSAASCWTYGSEVAGCTAANGCKWKNDSWGSWCEELNCWSLYTQNECTTTSVPNKNCTWQPGSTTYGCEKISCWSFSGTDQNTCESNTLSLNCQWNGNCYTEKWSPGINCWSYNTQSQCTNATGCKWGNCNEVGCWNFNTQGTCTTGKDSYSGKNCTWDIISGSGYCTNNGCWRYGTNQTRCGDSTLNGGLNCEWKWNSCQDIDCWSWSYTNSSACINNTINLSCSWDSQGYCNKQDCWSYSSNSTCSAKPNCVWKSYTSSGWCQEVNCWTWDSWSGGNQTLCEQNSYGLDCLWSGNPAGNLTNGWCYKDWTTTSCSNKTTERDCMDTYYCWWQYNDWNDVSAGGTCNDPGSWNTGTNSTITNEWNPGCYIFDMNATNCNNTLGCNYINGECDAKGDDYGVNVSSNGISCSYINDSSLCNSLGMLSSCCAWQNGTCAQNRLSTSCWDQMAKTPNGEDSCEDAKISSACNDLAGNPWYWPCSWSNSTSTCGFKVNDVWGNGTRSLLKIENKKNCEIAGGKWITENYCEGNVSVPTGRCEYKFDEEDNCDKACFACEIKDSDGNSINSTNAQSACEGSKLAMCEFTANNNAPNTVGYCKAKEQFKNGVVSNCDTSCGDCTFMGKSTSNESTKKPSYFCLNSKANSDGGGCKWASDNSTATGGNCINKGEKTCEDACDRCKSQTDCSNLGRTDISNQTGSCKWQGESNTGSCVANIAGDVEICWDAVDNDNDALVDCADPSCYSDTYCGFVETGSCSGYTGNSTCSSNGCEWITDKWGSWCDVRGSQCWKYETNLTTCNNQSNCQWNAGSSGSSSWCEKDWSIGEICMGSNRTQCEDASGQGCQWTNDTWCQQNPQDTWCLTGPGGWCDHTDFAPKNCWLYATTNTCNDAAGCSWKVDQWSKPMCEVNYSANCGQYNSNSTCTTGGCLWRNESYSWGSSAWCDNPMGECWSSSTQSTCEAVSGNKCRWKTESWGSMCEPACFSRNDSNTCGAVSGCVWKDNPGWCEESGGCWNFNENDCKGALGQDATCRWKSPGWCEPKGGGFSAGSVTGGGGIGGAMGAECYKYDGNQSLCTNRTAINISCGWFSEINPRCEVNWGEGANCWQYSGSACNATIGCWWNNDTITNNTYCTNVMDQCWSNQSLQGVENAGVCNANPYCNATAWSGCEPTCFSAAGQAACGSGCKWVTGWCNPASMNQMFTGMESGPPAPLGQDTCGEGIQSSADICGFGMKDMEDSYGIGIFVYDFSNASICNKVKLSSNVMGMAGGNMPGVGMSDAKIGTGNETVILFVYLDADGSTSGGCALSHNSSAVGYEFRLKYLSQWNANTSKATETFNAYKCDNSEWKATDTKISAWKEKMCSEVGGPMIALKKADLAKHPTLYNSTKDLRVYVVTLGNTGNVTSPTDTAGPGWTTPGTIDFEIANAFSYGADTAKFEDILKKGFVQYENCKNSIDDDGDGSTDCNDWSCQNSDFCDGIGVNAASYVDTTTPLVTGVKIEEYPDSALVMYDTNKPTNGTLEFYYNDSQCLSINTSIYDVGVLKANVRDYKLWHKAEVFNGAGSLAYALANDTTYYYKLKVCDNAGKCAVSKCTSLITLNTNRCGYCNFVTRLKAPSGWNVTYDLDTNGVYEHMQGQVCGPNAGMKTNYTNGRKANVKLVKSDGSVYIELLNVSLTKTGMNDKVRTVSSSGDVIGDTNKVGMTSETRDKLINNLNPEVCRLKIPFSGTCDTLYHCDEDGSNCVDKTAAAGGAPIDAVNCVWEIPFCEFSTYRESTSSSSTTTTSSGSGGGGGGGGGGTATSAITYVVTDEQFAAGYSKKMQAGDKMKFNIDGSSHSLALNSVLSDSVKITVSSDPQTATVSVGEEKNFELTNDDYYDLGAKLKSIESGNATIQIKSIHTKVQAIVAVVSQAASDTSQEEETSAGSVESNVANDIVGKAYSFKDYERPLSILGVLVIFTLVILILWLRHRK